MRRVTTCRLKMDTRLRIELWLCLALFCPVHSGFAESLKAPAGSAIVNQSATAPQGGIAIAFNAPNNVVNINNKDPAVDKELAAIEREIQHLGKELRATREQSPYRKAAFENVSRLAHQANAGLKAKEAERALASGNTAPSEALLREQEQAAAQSADDGNRRAAELARQQGALAFLHDTRAALAAYQRAARYEPDDVPTQILIGDLQSLLGDPDDARQAYLRVAQLARDNLDHGKDSVEWQRDLALSHNRIGELLMTQSNLAGALGEFQQALHILEPLASSSPDDLQVQRDLAATYSNIGNVQKKQGNLAVALVEYQKGIQIADTLLQRNPNNPDLELDIAANHLQLGDIMSDRNDLSNALAEFRLAMTGAEKVASRQQAENEETPGLSVGHHNADVIRIAARNGIGEVLIMQGDLDGALAIDQQAVNVAESLMKQDPNNTDWPQSIAAAQSDVAAVFMMKGDSANALAEYRKAQSGLEKLSANDPANTSYQGRLGTIHLGMADALAMSGDREGAVAEAKRATSIFEDLVKRDPTDSDWQASLVLCHYFAGNQSFVEHDLPVAASETRQALAILTQEADRDPSDLLVQKAIAESSLQLGEILESQGDRAGAITQLQKARTILERLNQQDATNAFVQMELANALVTLAVAQDSQGDHAEAAQHANEALSLIDDAAKRDPNNTMAQITLAETCLVVGRLSREPESQKAILGRGKSILQTLKSEDRLPSNYPDLLPAFDKALASVGN
ncbi:hypothetical protein D0B32_07905 [Paraburkholderia sp. DHOC27]|nr:hypothetical protein D0B32_07905 [Paraburkholderia sp. DHOC27]